MICWEYLGECDDFHLDPHAIRFANTMNWARNHFVCNRSLQNISHQMWYEQGSRIIYVSTDSALRKMFANEKCLWRENVWKVCLAEAFSSSFWNGLRMQAFERQPLKISSFYCTVDIAHDVTNEWISYIPPLSWKRFSTFFCNGFSYKTISRLIIKRKRKLLSLLATKNSRELFCSPQATLKLNPRSKIFMNFFALLNGQKISGIFGLLC